MASCYGDGKFRAMLFAKQTINAGIRIFNNRLALFITAIDLFRTKLYADSTGLAPIIENLLVIES